MDRRPHWDDDLVDGVGRRLIPLYRSIGYCTDAERHRIYTLIEFVEDWQDRTQQARAMSMTDNEAAIARVRELHREHVCDWASAPFACFIVHGGECAHRGKCRICHAEKCDTIRALDGAE